MFVGLCLFLGSPLQVGPALHLSCTAFSSAVPCTSNLTRPHRKRSKKLYGGGGAKVVGGVDSMPWMVGRELTQTTGVFRH